MMRTLPLAVLALWVAMATATAATETNVLQNVNIAFTIYQQGPYTTQGKKLTDKVTSYGTKNLIAALEGVIGADFGSGAKLVQATMFSNVVTVGSPIYSNTLTTNLAIAPPGGYLYAGGVPGSGIYNPFEPSAGNSAVIVISNNTFVSNEVGNVLTNILSNVNGATTNTVTIYNPGLTTITPSLDTNGFVTNVQIVTEQQVSNTVGGSVFTNIGTSMDILYGGNASLLYPVTSYFMVTPNSAEIAVEAGLGLDSTNAIVTSQSAVSISNLQVNYFMTNSTNNNLNIDLTAFVKQTLKVDTLSSSRGNKVVEDIYGGSSTWAVIGSGYTGGNFTSASNSSDPTAMPVGNYVNGGLVTGYLTNTTPIVVQGTVTVSFLKNIAQ